MFRPYTNPVQAKSVSSRIMMSVSKKCALYGSLLGWLVRMLFAQPNWERIRANARFFVADTSLYEMPVLLPLTTGGWEDGLYVTRDGQHLFCTYIPGDILSWLRNWYLCKPFTPYLRGPLLDVDTLTNPFGCSSYIHSDIVRAAWDIQTQSFSAWQPSSLRKSVTYEGGACGVLKNRDSFDVFVFTMDTGALGMEIMFLRNVPLNPSHIGAIPILSSPAHEDNPHIERLSDGRLLLFFDRDREIYYAISADDGQTWSTPVRSTRILNDQAPYDVQPHLWFDGIDWWVYFSADDERGFRSIYRARQLIPDDWDSWGEKELVVAPLGVDSGYANIIAIGDPSLTAEGDLYFVVGYGNTLLPDTTNVFDADPWVMRRKRSTSFPTVAILCPRLQYDPISETICVTGISPEGRMYLYDYTGRLLCSTSFQTDEACINAQALLPSVYTVLIESEKQIHTFRWVKLY